MRLAIKLLKGDQFEVEANANGSVEELKKLIEASRPADVGPGGVQKLILSGKILEDGLTLSALGLKDGDFLVCMNKKVEAQAAPAISSSAQPTPAPVAPAASPAAAGQQDPASMQADAGGGMMGNDAFGETVELLCGMGFPKSMVEQCLRAAFGNPDRAVEYLMNGIPQAVQQMVAPPAPAAAPTPAQQPGYVPGGQGQAPAQGGHQQRAPMFIPPPTGPPGPLHELRISPYWPRIRQAVHSNPHSLGQLMTALQQANDRFPKMIIEHQEEFVKLLAEPIPAQPTGAGMPQQQMPMQMPAPIPAPQPQVPQMPPQQASTQLDAHAEEAIQRLSDLGFPRAACLEAYLACDRNEEMAANYLFENAENA